MEWLKQHAGNLYEGSSIALVINFLKLPQLDLL